MACITSREWLSWPRGFARAFLGGIALFLALFAVPAAAAPRGCASLGNGTQIGNATVVLAQSIPAGDYTAIDGIKLKGLPAFCRVFAIASPHPSSRILIEIWMPMADRWNGKLLGTGNGGAGGKITSGALAGGLRRGFATANTDLGSYPAGLPGVGFNFGDDRPEMIRDWAFRATHEMTVLAKDVVARFYGRAATKSYFAGCSTGGHQALMEAQRYPDDYDGIIAGAPAHNRTHLHTRFAALRQLGVQPGAALPMPLMKAWRATILKSCAGRDGGSSDDPFLTDPLLCSVSPRQLACRSGAKEGSCLSDTQVRAIETVYAGTRNPRTGEMIYFGDVRGSEDQIAMVYGEGFFSANFDLTNWILPPDRGASSFDFDRDMAALDDAYANGVNAMNPDLSRFAARGGKLIIFHGWEDGLITPTDSIDYYQRLGISNKDRASFARLFMVPGLQHCYGGGGPSAFGQLPEVPLAADATADSDLLLALDRWVGTGAAPEAVAGRGISVPPSASVGDKATDAGIRPICAFPKIARYNGKGDPHLASSFMCSKASVPSYERPAARYLR